MWQLTLRLWSESLLLELHNVQYVPSTDYKQPVSTRSEHVSSSVRLIDRLDSEACASIVTCTSRRAELQQSIDLPFEQ